jgi:hypothetical protein
MKNNRLRIVVMGYIVRGPLAGYAWHHLQYVLGLKALGHDVFFLEDSGNYPGCYDPARSIMDDNPNYGLKFASACFRRFDLDHHWAYYDAHTHQWLGSAADDAVRFCSEADLLLDLSPHDPIRPWVEQIPRRALIDTDPAFTQIDHLQDPEARQIACKHNAYFSFGENIGMPQSTIPDDEFTWRPTRQPMVLDCWPVTPGPSQGYFTTVMQWDSYKPLQYQGRSFGMKSTSFQEYIDLPGYTGQILEIALGSSTAPREDLLNRGWRLLNSIDVSLDLELYQNFIQNSKSEFSVAKHGYVTTRSGWFSERSAAYLATGRPTIVQDTGYSDWLPTGLGVLAFVTAEEAIDAIQDVNHRYETHCRASREIAREYFDYRNVLTNLIDRAMDTQWQPDTVESA